MKEKHMRIFSVANQKGGVGKTTTAVNLATAVAALKKKVLLIDLDAQGNATVSLGVSGQGKQHNSYTVLTRTNIKEKRKPYAINKHSSFLCQNRKNNIFC